MGRRITPLLAKLLDIPLEAVNARDLLTAAFDLERFDLMFPQDVAAKGAVGIQAAAGIGLFGAMALLNPTGSKANVILVAAGAHASGASGVNLAMATETQILVTANMITPVLVASRDLQWGTSGAAAAQPGDAIARVGAPNNLPGVRFDNGVVGATISHQFRNLPALVVPGTGIMLQLRTDNLDLNAAMAWVERPVAVNA